MGLCGFNEKMVGGLEALNEGLVEHGLLFRSKKNGESIDQAIKRELSDMLRLLEETRRIEDTPKRILTEGLIRYVMGFYLLIRSNGAEEYKMIVRQVSNYFWAMDNKYYSELEGRPEDMKELAEFLNGVVIELDELISV